MQEQFIKSLQVIRVLDIKKQSDYENLTNYFLILSSESLKYISQKNNFSEIVDMANSLD